MRRVAIAATLLAISFMLVRTFTARESTPAETPEPSTETMPTVGEAASRPAPQKAADEPRPEASAADERDEAYYQVDAPLDERERQQFIAELKSVFLERLPGAVDTSALMPDVIRLNERYRRGVRTIVDQLAKPAGDDAEVQTRLASIDYLRYRMAWDERARHDVKDLIVAPIPTDTPVRYKAAWIGDKLELVAGLARHDWSMALEALEAVEDRWLARKLASEALAIRTQDVTDATTARAEVMLVVPELI